MDQQGSCVMAERSSRSEAAILSLLLDMNSGCIWSAEELVRELSAPRLDVLDALASLEGAGLVHRSGKFVFASRAASRFDQLDM
jgi:DNA-binding GntR family transcriptional regulator